MAQIKKLQPGGTTPEKTTPKYGRLIQNGVEIQANDDMINWLAQQGYYGEQMANNLRNGDDQYLDTDEQGVGWIRNISVANPELKEKQQERTTRASRRLEGRRLTQARTDIQRLATYDYSKFIKQPEKPKAKTPYKWDTLVIDYNTKEDGTKEFSNNQVNFDIIQRLKDLKEGLVIPEDQEFKDYDRVVQHYNNIKDLLGDLEKDGKNKGVISRMRAGKLTADDEDILEGLGILATAPKKEVAATKEELEKANGEAITKGVKYWLSKNLKLNGSDLSTHSSYWTTNDSNELVATDELYKLIGGTYKNYWFSPDSPYNGYVLLNGKLTSTNLVDEKGKQTAFGKWWESSAGQEFKRKYRAGLWKDAAEHMAFEGSNQTWNYIDPDTKVSQYLDPGVVYYDVSHHYDFKPEYGYVGAITKIDDPVNGELLPSYRDYAIKEDGTLVDISTIGGQYTTPLRPSNRPTKLTVYDINLDGNFRKFDYPYIDGAGKKHNITVTLDQNGHVVKLTEDGEDFNDFQNDRSNVWAIIREYLDKKTGKNTRTFAQSNIPPLNRQYLQPGGKLKSPTENKNHIEQISGYITDPTKPYSLKDAKEGFSLGAADWADIISLGLDLGGLTLGEVPIAGEAAGYGSDLATLYADIVRDGFQLSDLGSFAGNVVLTSLGFVPTLGTGFGAGKLISKLKKVAPILNGAFMAYGLYEGGQALADILKGDLNVDTARGLMNGIMLLRGIHKNKKSHRLMDEYGEPKTKTNPKSRKRAGVPDLLEGLSTKDQNEILDALLKDRPELKYLDAEMKVPAKDWFDGDKITSYDEAWKAIGSKFTEAEIKKHRSGWQRVENSIGKGKNTVSEGANSIWDKVKRRTTRANPEDYSLKSDINDELLEALRGESTGWGRKIYAPRLKEKYMWNIPIEKKGGKIKKCRPGNILSQFSDTDIFGNPIVSPNFKFTTQMPHPESSIEHATKGVLENSKGYNTTVSTLNGTRYLNSSINAPLIDYTGNITTNNLTAEQKAEARQWAQDRVTETWNKQKQKNGAVGLSNANRNIDWVGLSGPIVEGAVNSIANKRIHDQAQKALDIEAVGGQKSQSVQQPRQDYNLNPTLSLADRNKAEAWSRSNALASASADQRLRMSQHNFTAGNVAKAEQDLLGNVSRHITDVDLANTKLEWQFDKDAQAVKDHNHTFGAQIGAQKARLKAQHIQQQGTDLIKRIVTESRDQYNKYKNVAGYAKNWDTYLKYHDELMNEKDETKKRELQSKLLLFKTMLESGSVMNPYTGITAADYLTNKLNRE